MDLNDPEVAAAAKIQFAEALFRVWYKVPGEIRSMITEGAQLEAESKGADPMVAAMEVSTTADRFGFSYADAQPLRQEVLAKQNRDREARAREMEARNREYLIK
ncbi:hypothetical protein [Palleronia pelagia]|uniref:Uncharacterized protein n=1 Tax=Palleronia pelagia TaxID=387096 RepID=A0A1H8M822_9RHOB|nr:hypothetical protein [Palleronia pelagia]SEO13358.1 hypothetical protein SAMN04488011_1143 [Palleronia pelagia]